MPYDVKGLTSRSSSLGALAKGHIAHHMTWVKTGEDALEFVRQAGKCARAPRPDLILLDLNLPKMDGRQVLAEIKQDDALKTIPTVILTTSEAEEDIAKVYQLSANCYLTKPVQFAAFEALVKSISEFWLTMARLPPQMRVAAEKAS